MARRAALAALLALAAPLRALAEEAAVPAALGAGAPDMGAAALRVAVCLAIVVAAVQALRWAVGRWGARIPGLDPRMQAIRVVATRYLGPRKSLALVEVEGRRILLGLGAAEIRPLAVFDDAVDLRRERAAPEPEEERYDA